MEIGDKFYSWTFGQMTVVDFNRDYLTLSCDDHPMETHCYNRGSIGKFIHSNKEDALLNNVVSSSEQDYSSGHAMKTLAFSEFNHIYQDILINFRNDPHLIDKATSEVNKSYADFIGFMTEHSELWTKDSKTFLMDFCRNHQQIWENRYDELVSHSSDYADITEYKKLSDCADVSRRIYRLLIGCGFHMLKDEDSDMIVEKLSPIPESVVRKVLSSVLPEYNTYYQQIDSLFVKKNELKEKYDKAQKRYDMIKKFSALLRQGYIDFSK